MPGGCAGFRPRTFPPGSWLRLSSSGRTGRGGPEPAQPQAVSDQAGYVLVYYAAREVRGIFTEDC